MLYSAVRKDVGPSPASAAQTPEGADVISQSYSLGSQPLSLMISTKVSYFLVRKLAMSHSPGHSPFRLDILKGQVLPSPQFGVLHRLTEVIDSRGCTDHP